MIQYKQQDERTGGLPDLLLLLSAGPRPGPVGPARPAARPARRPKHTDFESRRFSQPAPAGPCGPAWTGPQEGDSKRSPNHPPLFPTKLNHP